MSAQNSRLREKKKVENLEKRMELATQELESTKEHVRNVEKDNYKLRQQLTFLKHQKSLQDASQT